MMKPDSICLIQPGLISSKRLLVDTLVHFALSKCLLNYELKPLMSKIRIFSHARGLHCVLTAYVMYMYMYMLFRSLYVDLNIHVRAFLCP